MTGRVNRRFLDICAGSTESDPRAADLSTTELSLTRGKKIDGVVGSNGAPPVRKLHVVPNTTVGRELLLESTHNVGELDTVTLLGCWADARVKIWSDLVSRARVRVR